MAKAAAPKFPKSLGACADLYKQKKDERLAADKVAAALKAEESAIKQHIIDHLDKDSSGVAGQLVRVAVTVDAVPQIEDWDKAVAWISKSKRFDLLQRRLSVAAVKELWDDGKEVPGIGCFMKVDLSMNKL